MTNKLRKLQKTIRFEPDVARAVAERARRIGLPFANVVNNLARTALLSSSADPCEAELKQLRTNVLSRLNKLEHEMGRELTIIRELLALLTRTYLNHTPEITGNDREPASMSGRLRFAQLVERLERNVHDGVSILSNGKGPHDN